MCVCPSAKAGATETEDSICTDDALAVRDDDEEKPQLEKLTEKLTLQLFPTRVV
jgi:hypothetical protein